MKILEDVEKIIFKTNWISILETEKGFQYLRRKGKNSVAIFLVRDGKLGQEALIRYQPLPIQNNDDSLFPCPITGSIDEGESPINTAIREVLEESGYDIRDNIVNLGKYVVGTQTDEIVHMFYADVNNKINATPENDGGYHESISKNIWEPLSNLKNYQYSACQIMYYKLNEVLNDY